MTGKESLISNVGNKIRVQLYYQLWGLKGLINEIIKEEPLSWVSSK